MRRSEPAQTTGSSSTPVDGGAVQPSWPVGDEGRALVEHVISEEFAALRDAFRTGAEFAVTRMETPRERMLHRLECPALEPYLDRRAQWSDQHRKRLADDHGYRLALPTLVTRHDAVRLAETRNCKVCWPNVHGTEPRPLRRLQARGLRAHHVGHVLSRADAQSLGTIVRMAPKSGLGLDGVWREEVEIVTSWDTLAYAPREHVFIWDLPTDEEAIRRKTALFHRLGTNLTPAF